MAASEDSIRVLLVEDHAVVRAGLRMLIESWPRVVVVGEAGDRADALRLVAEQQPNIILLDLDLGADSGLDFLPQLLDRAPAAHVLLLTGVDDPEQHQRAVRLGALGVVRKDQAASVLLKAIERVHAGEAWLDRTMVARVLSDLARPPEPAPNPEAARIASLTDRECQVIQLICEGLPNKGIADRLAISEATVRHHLTAIFSKLGLTSRLELVIYAYQHDLAKPPR
jgi:DNA-binding NarL/FixJ family response regulator